MVVLHICIRSFSFPTEFRYSFLTLLTHISPSHPRGTQYQPEEPISAPRSVQMAVLDTLVSLKTWQLAGLAVAGFVVYVS